MEANGKRLDIPDYPEGWFQVAYSKDLEPGDIIPLHYFGTELICYRGAEDHQVHVLDAFCAHLGAHIGYGGFVEGDCVRCPFHQWMYDASGKNVDIPYRERPNRGARLRAWPAREVNGMVMVWYGEEHAEPWWEVPEAPEFRDDSSAYVVEESGRYTIHTHPQEVFENTVDVPHFKYVHGVAGFGAVELVEDGPMLRANAAVTYETKRGDVQGVISSELWGLGVDIVHPRGIGEACAFLTLTTIDPGAVDARYTFILPRDQETGEITRYGDGIKREFLRQIHQDIPIWERKIYREHPKLAMGENPLVDYRRWAEQFYPQAAVVAPT